MIIGVIPRGMNLKEKTIWAVRQKIILKIQFLTGDRCEIYGPTIAFFSNSASWRRVASGHIFIREGNDLHCRAFQLRVGYGEGIDFFGVGYD